MYLYVLYTYNTKVFNGFYFSRRIGWLLLVFRGKKYGGTKRRFEFMYKKREGEKKEGNKKSISLYLCVLLYDVIFAIV